MPNEAAQILDNAQGPAVQPAAPVAPQTSQVAPKDEAIAPKLTVLMERERQALNRERMAKAHEEKLKEQLQRIEQFESIKTDPKKALDYLGLSYDQLTQSILKDGEIPPSVEIQRLREELEQFKSKQQERIDLEAEERKKQTLQAESKAVTDFKSEINDYLKNNTSRYDLIDFEGAHDLVFDVIDEHYNRTVNPETGVGEVMSIAQASDKVEEHLEKKYLAAKDRSKVKAFWGTLPKSIQEQLKKPEVSQPPRTLTNNMGPKVLERPQRPPEDLRVKQIVQDFIKQRQSRAG